MPLPDTCNARDPGDWNRMCLKPSGHEDAHAHQWITDRDGIRRTALIEWDQVGNRPFRPGLSAAERSRVRRAIEERMYAEADARIARMYHSPVCHRGEHDQCKGERKGNAGCLCTCHDEF